MAKIMEQYQYEEVETGVLYEYEAAGDLTGMAMGTAALSALRAGIKLAVMSGTGHLICPALIS